MRTYSSDSISAHAYVVQGRAFVASGPPIGAAVALFAFGLDEWAVASALIATALLGVSAGAWLTAERMKG